MIGSFFSAWIVLGVLLALPALFAPRDRDGSDRPFVPLFIMWLGFTSIGGFLSLVFSLAGSVLSSRIALLVGIVGLVVFLGARKSSQKVE